MGLFRKTALLVCAICCLVNFGSESLRTEKLTGLRGTGYRLGVSYTDDQVTTGSAVQCAAICTSSADCRTISWNKGQELCLLSSSDVTHDRKAFNHILDRDAAWDTMSVMEYTVFIGYNSSWLPMSLQMGRDLCVKRQTVIASPSDLSYSQSIGFTFNKCTWMSDGTLGLARFPQGITPCNTGWDPFVLCILN